MLKLASGPNLCQLPDGGSSISGHRRRRVRGIACSRHGAKSYPDYRDASARTVVVGPPILQSPVESRSGGISLQGSEGPCDPPGAGPGTLQHARNAGSIKNKQVQHCCWTYSFQSGRRDLNARPSRWQRDALPLSYARIVAKPYGLAGRDGTRLSVGRQDL